MGDVMAISVAAVGDDEAFALVCRNPARELQALLSALRACVLEADRAELKRIREHTDFVTSDKDRSGFTEAVEDLLKAFLVYRQIVQREDNNNVCRPYRGNE